MPTARPARPRAPKAAVDPASVVEQAFEAAVAAARGPVAVPSSLFARRRKRAQTRIREAVEARGTPSIPDALRREIKTLAQQWAAQDFEDGFEQAEKLEIRLFEEGELVAAQQSGDQARIFTAMEAKHRTAILNEHGVIEIRGLQMSARVYQSLDVVYVPLHVQDPSSQGETLRLSDQLQVRTIPRLSVPELLAKHERSLIVGAPGSGKTTVVSYLASQAAAHHLHKDIGWKKSPVPFVVAVRSLDAPRLDEHIIAGLSGCDPEFVRQVLEDKRGLVLVDGLDEARGGPAGLLSPLVDFAKRFPGNRMIVTTRPAGDRKNEPLKLPGFAPATLLPMTRDEVHLFIERWCRAAELNIQKDPQRAKVDAERAAKDLQSRVQSSRAVERLAETPLLCSVLCIVHRFLGQRIPERRVALYEACTNVLLYEWDRAKFQNGSSLGQLDAQAKRFLLSGLAHSMHKKHASEVAAEDVVKHFADKLPSIQRSPEEAQTLAREIQERSGILVERRPGMFAFSHLTFQEYLTAVEIVQAGTLKSLARRHADPWWHEVIALAAGLPGADAAALVRALLKADGNKTSTGTLLAAHCVDTAIHLPVPLQREVENRLAVLVPPQTDDDVDRLVALGNVVAPILLRALDGTDANCTARIAIALGRLGYEPATSTLIEFLSDNRSTKIAIPIAIGEAALYPFGFRVGTIALFTLLHLSISSNITRSAFERALRELDAINEQATNMLLAWCDNLRKVTATTRVGIDSIDYFEELYTKLKAIRQEKRRTRLAARFG